VEVVRRVDRAPLGRDVVAVDPHLQTTTRDLGVAELDLVAQIVIRLRRDPTVGAANDVPANGLVVP